MMEDGRNVIDAFKGMTEKAIVRKLDENGVDLEIAIENVERDFSMGSIVRSANAFGVRRVHVIGKKQWNKRGAMATDKYLHVEHHPTMGEFMSLMGGKYVVAVDNLDGAQDITKAELPMNTVLVFGSEASGISRELSNSADAVVEIRQRGSTRSMNVGAAAAVAMYEWCRRNG